MRKSSTVSLGVLVVVLAAAAVAYVYYSISVPGMRRPTNLQISVAQPDNSILAGQVTAVSAKSITIRKQDTSMATIGITASTTILVSQATGGSAPGKVSDLVAGKMVLINPDNSDPSNARSIIIIAPSPAAK